MKSAYSHLTTAFADGVTCVDEISEIQGEDFLRFTAVRTLGRGPHKYGATGMPLSNFLADAYYPIGWSLGFGTPQFPYDHAAGRAKFEANFCTVEHMHGREEDGEENVKKRRKILPQICTSRSSAHSLMTNPPDAYTQLRNRLGQLRGCKGQGCRTAEGP